LARFFISCLSRAPVLRTVAETDVAVTRRSLYSNVVYDRPKPNGYRGPMGIPRVAGYQLPVVRSARDN
jgi:hypothetical protein